MYHFWFLQVQGDVPRNMRLVPCANSFVTLLFLMLGTFGEGTFGKHVLCRSSLGCSFSVPKASRNEPGNTKHVPLETPFFKHPKIVFQSERQRICCCPPKDMFKHSTARTVLNALFCSIWIPRSLKREKSLQSERFHRTKMQKVQKRWTPQRGKCGRCS